MSKSYARKSVLSRVDRTITTDSSKDSDGELFKIVCCTTDYPSVEFQYVKDKLERKYAFKFKDYYKRMEVFENWERVKDSLSVAKQPAATPKKPTKPKVMKENHWDKAAKETLSPSEALQRFNDLKAAERRQRLLEEARNVDLLW